MDEYKEFMITATEENFQDLISSDTPVLVKFGAEWCGPCKTIAPTLEELEKQFDGKLKVVAVDIDTTPAIATKYSIRGVPTMLFVKHGEVVNTLVGSQTKGRLELAIEALLA